MKYPRALASRSCCRRPAIRFSHRVFGAACLVLLAGLKQAPASAQGGPAPKASSLLFQAEGQKLSGACAGQPVQVEGNRNTLELSGPCASLLLKGVGNTVGLSIAPGGSLRIEGSGNHVRTSAEAASGAIVLGPDNQVTPDGPAINVPAPAALPAPAVPAPRPAAPVPSIPKPMPAKAEAGPLALGGQDQERIEDCAGRDVTVTGLRSAYVLHGLCRSLTVHGDLLSVQAEMASGARIEVTGRGDVVSYRLKPKARAPAAKVAGPGSRVQRADLAPAGG